jgi:putative FmdB family regulatory protein
MPNYTFRCPKCGYKFSGMFLMKDHDGGKVICPKCKSKGVKRVFEGSFFIGKSRQSSCPTGTCRLAEK